MTHTLGSERVDGRATVKPVVFVACASASPVSEAVWWGDQETGVLLGLEPCLPTWTLCPGRRLRLLGPQPGSRKQWAVTSSGVSSVRRSPPSVLAWLALCAYLRPRPLS